MIGFLEGVLLSKEPTQVLLKVGGVGYQVFISLTTFYALPEPPATVALKIFTRLADDALQLYGFHDQEEKDLFLQLITIPRIGARMAINILSGISPEEFREALAGRDLKRLCRIPGLGRKSAERLLVELQDRLSPPDRSRASATPEDLTYAEALSALLNLGYPKNQAETALAGARSQGAASLEELLRRSLKILAR
jgi:Holliday junction DNA helicase RuvA